MEKRSLKIIHSKSINNKALSKYFNLEKDSNFKIKFKDSKEIIFCHKFILTSRCEFFKLMFMSNTKESLQNELIVEENSKLYLTILRRGGISYEKIEKKILNFDEEIIYSSSFKKVKNDTKIGQPAPGQMITHYAPDISTFLVKNISNEDLSKNFDLKTTVIIDFENTLEISKEFCLKYFNLSEKGDILEATNNVFDILRKSEKVENAKLILLADVSLKKVEDSPALFDRMFRSASGKYVSFFSNLFFY